MLMPAGTTVPDGFDYRDLQSCIVEMDLSMVILGMVMFFQPSHDLTVGGILENGYEPDYSYGWSVQKYMLGFTF